MKIKTENNKDLVVTFSVDVTPLQEKLKLLLEIKFCAFECILDKSVCKRFDFFFNSIINDSDILASDFVVTSFTSESDQIICVFDFDIANFIWQLLIAMRTGNFNCNTFFHNDSLL